MHGGRKTRRSTRVMHGGAATLANLYTAQAAINKAIDSLSGVGYPDATAVAPQADTTLPADTTTTTTNASQTGGKTKNSKRGGGMKNPDKAVSAILEKYEAYYVEVPVAVQREQMALSKMSEAMVSGKVEGEGASLDQFLKAQPDTKTVINGGFFYFAKMEETYGMGPPKGKVIGDGIGLFKIREYSSAETEATADISIPQVLPGSFRIGWLVQTRRGEPFELRPNRPQEAPPSFADHKYILTCSPVLIDEGKRTPLPTTQGEKMGTKGPPGHLGHLVQPNQRSMIGQRADGTILLVSTQRKIVFEEMQEVMEALGSKVALGLDGGGSTFLWNDGKLRVQGDGDRLVGNAIVVFEK